MLIRVRIFRLANKNKLACILCSICNAPQW